MPTKRAFLLLLLASALYMLANQTQVGWVYIMVNMVIGLLVAAFFFSRGSLKGLSIQRSFHNLSSQSARYGQDPNSFLTLSEFFEDDTLEVGLHIYQPRLKPAFLIQGTEICPFAPTADQTQPFFVPNLFKKQKVDLYYQTACHRRGFYTFAPLKLHSKGAFSLFHSRHTVDASNPMLIYPQYHPLKRLRLIENRGFTDKAMLRVGTGSEVIGTREYRSGDSLRQIHWRSTARVGKLVVKEFLDHDQLTITVVLDLSTGGNIGAGKFSTFETAIRLAATFGYYATQQNIPFHLRGHSPRWKPPGMALSWSGILNYLAKAENDGQKSLATVLHHLPPQPFVVVLISNSADETLTPELDNLQRKGIQTLAIYITPADTPLTANKNRPGLDVKTVTPHNWTTLFADL